MENQFREGDIVQLKSGGCPMTVERVSEDSLVHCIWLDGKNNIRTHSFLAATLTMERADRSISFTPNIETD